MFRAARLARVATAVREAAHPLAAHAGSRRPCAAASVGVTTTSMRRRASLRQRLNISRFALAHPRLPIGAWLLIAAAGLVAAWKLPVALFPDIVFPVVVVT